MSGADGAPRRLWIERTKWPDRPQSRAQAYLLGEDQHGTWLGLPGGHEVYRSGAVLYRGPNPVVTCVPHEQWWVANWYGRTVELFVDIVTPARWGPDGLTVVDLDYGIMLKDGDARLVDAEQFEENRLTYEYPSTVEAGARRASQEVLARVEAGDLPFTLDLAAGWFAILRAVADGAPNDGRSV